MGTATKVGQAGLQGWREKAADAIAEPVAQRTPLEEEQVRALVGATFFLLAALYVLKTLRAGTERARG